MGGKALNGNKITCDEAYDLYNHASRSLSFIEGQLKYCMYDSQDIFGECGHVTTLYLIQEVIFQKAQELGIQNPYNAFAESYELQCHRVTGPKPPTNQELL